MANDQPPIVNIDAPVVIPEVIQQDPIHPVQTRLDEIIDTSLNEGSRFVDKMEVNPALYLLNSNPYENGEPLASSSKTYNLRSRKDKRKSVADEAFVSDNQLLTDAHMSNRSRKGKAKLVLDDELEAELNESLPILNYSFKSENSNIMNENLDIIENQRNEENPLPLIPEQEPALNMAVNERIGDGEIVAEIEVNDVYAFLDLVGIQGPFTKLIQSISLAHLIIMLILGIGIWIPYLIGNFSLFLFFKIIIPSLQVSFKRLIYTIQIISDPIVDPLVDEILKFMNLSSANSILKISVLANNASISYNNASQVAFGPYHANFYQSFKEDLNLVFIGYSMICAGILIYSNRMVDYVQNPYLQSLTRFAQSINAQLTSAIKVSNYQNMLIDRLSYLLFWNSLASHFTAVY